MNRYHADPSDHDAVARALLEKLHDSDAQEHAAACLAAARGRAKVLRDILAECIPWLRHAIGADLEQIVEIGGNPEWPPSVLAARADELVRGFDAEIAREMREQRHAT